MRSGRLLTEAICLMGRAEVFVAMTQCSGTTASNWKLKNAYFVDKQPYLLNNLVFQTQIFENGLDHDITFA